MSLSKELDKVFAKTPEVNGSIQGARNLKRSAPDMSVFKFPSKKAGATLYVEGNLEHSAIIIAEGSTLVRNIRTQPIYIQLSAKHYSIPDLAIELHDESRIIVEIKPSRTALTFEQEDRFFAAEQLLAREDIGFKLLDQNDLPNYATTQKLLHMYCRGHRTKWHSYVLEEALSLLTLDTYTTLASMQEILREKGMSIHLAEYFVFHQKKKTLETNYLFNKVFSV